MAELKNGRHHDSDSDSDLFGDLETLFRAHIATIIPPAQVLMRLQFASKINEENCGFRHLSHRRCGRRLVPAPGHRMRALHNYTHAPSLC